MGVQHFLGLRTNTPSYTFHICTEPRKNCLQIFPLPFTPYKTHKSGNAHQSIWLGKHILRLQIRRCGADTDSCLPKSTSFSLTPNPTVRNSNTPALKLHFLDSLLNRSGQHVVIKTVEWGFQESCLGGWVCSFPLEYFSSLLPRTWWRWLVLQQLLMTLRQP